MKAPRAFVLFGSRIFRGQFFTQLFLIAGCSLLFSLAIGLRTSVELMDRQKAIAERYRDQISATLGEWLRSKGAALDAFTLILAEEDAEGLRSARVNDRISRLLTIYDEFTDILVIAENGRVVNSRAAMPETRIVDLSDREYFREAMEGRLGVAGFYAGRNTGKTIMTIARRFSAADGRTFVAAAVITQKRFAELMRSIEDSGFGSAYLVDSSAKRISAEDIREEANDAARGAAAGKTGVAVYRNAAGDAVVGAYARQPDFDAGLVFELREELLTAPLERLQRFVLAIGLLGAALAVFVSFAAAARVYRPLEELIRAVDGIAESDYSRAVAPSADNELGALIERIDRMRRRIAERETSLKDSASRDSLTGLLNHRALMERLRQLSRDERRASICFAMIDIDHFKRINDEYGHQAGDSVLTQLAELLRSAVRGEDVVGRYGGEEFAVVLKEWSETDNEAFCERLRRRIEQADFRYEGRRIPVTASIGWACADTSGEPENGTLVGQADAALYRAKAAGRNRVERG